MAYNISKAFKRIEEELIASMMRNLDHHRAMETDEGMNWTQWQAEQLAALQRYRVNNEKKYGKEFAKINKKIPQLIRMARAEGNMDQEAALMEAAAKGANISPQDTPLVAEFFGINDRKIDALVNATTNDMAQAEYAVLRKANDDYRQIIYDAQVYANAGGTTYEKAVDMATKDFLARGIQCIEYSNGAKHTISDYADMAIKTATKRAYLTGEGEMRNKWGEHLVIINKRTDACPKCMPFAGKIMIDDVWSGGTADDGPYPLLSSAIAAGLYHPRCRDSHTTYFPGISTPPEGYTKEELKEKEASYDADQKQKAAEKEAEKYERMARYSLDPENKAEAMRKAEALAPKQKGIHIPESLESVVDGAVEKVVDTKVCSDIMDTEFLLRSNSPGQNVTRERLKVIEAISSTPEKVLSAMKNTVIDVGRIGASAYDYQKDIIWISKGTTGEDVIHEIGHLVDNKLVDDDVKQSLFDIFKDDLKVENIKTDTFYDNAGNPYNVFYIKSDKFVSDYQGRLYINHFNEAQDENGEIRTDLMLEVVSEAYREFIQNPDIMKEKHSLMYTIIKEVCS